MLRAAAAISASVVVLAAAGCGGDSSTSTGASAADTAATSVPTATTPATTATPAAATCTKVAAPAPKGEQSLTAPTTRLDPAKTWTATVKTNCGDFTIALDAKQAPKTSASFASLARTGFYNGLTFHRIVPGFVIQGGDPLGNGQGGPGYSVVEAPPATLKYTRGVVAMAKTEAEAPGTSGSQFFVVTGADAALPPDYALAGRVKSGQDVVDLIGKVPTDPQTQQPLSPVVIEKITITGS